VFTLYRLLPLSVRPTYYYNLRAALFNGVALGVGHLFHTIAAQVLGASAWHLALIDSLAGVGMIMAWFVGSFVGQRRKMPFVFWPWVASAVMYFLLGWVSVPLGFCVLAGSLTLVGRVSMPAAAGIMRANYPARIRGMITGFTRRWFFLVATLTALVGSELIHHWPNTWRGILATGGVCSLIAAFLFCRIRVRGEARLETAPPRPTGLLEPFRVLVRDRNFRSYIIAFFIFGAANLMMRPLLPIVLKEDMDADFRQMQWAWSIIPNLLVVLTVGLWGKVLDRSNPITMRAWMNTIWAIMPLLVFLAPDGPLKLGSGGFRIQPLWFVYAGRFCQGLVFGGQGLVWALGVMYFARKDQVPLYMGVHVGLTGLRATLFPLAGPLIVKLMGEGADARRQLFLLAAGLIMLSTLLMFRLAARIKREHGGRIPSFADHEAAEENGAG